MNCWKYDACRLHRSLSTKEGGTESRSKMEVKEELGHDGKQMDKRDSLWHKERVPVSKLPYTQRWKAQTWSPACEPPARKKQGDIRTFTEITAQYLSPTSMYSLIDECSV